MSGSNMAKQAAYYDARYTGNAVAPPELQGHRNAKLATANVRAVNLDE